MVTRGVDWVEPDMYLMGIELLLEALLQPSVVHKLGHLYHYHVLLPPLRAQQQRRYRINTCIEPLSNLWLSEVC